jgi:hypothetical protein
MRSILFLILLILFFAFRVEAQSEVATQVPPVVRSSEAKTTPSVPPQEDRSLTETIIDFMKSLLEDEPEPIDESLLRDPL